MKIIPEYPILAKSDTTISSLVLKSKNQLNCHQKTIKQFNEKIKINEFLIFFFNNMKSAKIKKSSEDINGGIEEGAIFIITTDFNPTSSQMEAKNNKKRRA